MRALVKSGDTNTIVRFANRAGGRESKIQIMAANYLQSVDWKEHQQAIRKYYQNAGAWDSLASFYEAMASAEVEESGNYDKAVSHLKEGLNALSSAKNLELNKSQQRTAEMNKKISGIEDFLDAKKLYETNPAEALKLLQEFVAPQNLSKSVIRPGDVYGLLITHYVKKDNMKRAQHFLEELNERHPGEGSQFLTSDIIDKIQAELGGTDDVQNNNMGQDDEGFVPEAASLTRKLKKEKALNSDDWLTPGNM